MSGVNVSRAQGHCHKIHCSKSGIYDVGGTLGCRQHVRALLDAALQADLIERVKTVTTKIAEKANAEGKIAPLSDAEEEAIIEHYADDFPAGMVMSQESHYEGEDEPDEGKED